MDPCVKCGGMDDEGLILVCDQCDLPIHANCHTPAKTTALLGDWLCATCYTSEVASSAGRASRASLADRPGRASRDARRARLDHRFTPLARQERRR